MTEKVLTESDYIISVTENGFPRYSEEEAVRGLEAIEEREDLDILQTLEEGKGLYEIYSSGIGEDLDRLEEAKMIERPDSGNDYIKLTRLSRTYLQYHRKQF